MKNNKVLLYTLIVSLGGFIFGFDASVISGAIAQITTEFELSTIEQGLIVSAPTLGAIVATIFAGFLADTFDRRTTLKIIAFLYLVSAALSAIAINESWLIAARFIGGLAFCSLMIAPMYIAEISRPEARGKMVSINQLNIVIGFSVAYFANYFILGFSQSNALWVTHFGIDTHTWRWMLGLEVLPALLYFIGLFFIPKSPRWLTVTGRHNEAKTALSKLYPAMSEQEQSREILHIENTGKVCSPLVNRLSALFGSKMRFVLGVGLIVGIAQQVTGVNAIYFYAPSIFEQSGIGTNAAFAQAIWVGVINIIFTLVAMALIDKVGRKPLLLFGLTGVVISMLICSYGYREAQYVLTANDIASLTQIDKHTELSAIQDVIYSSDVEFKNAVADLIGSVNLQSHQGAIIQAAAQLNATLILLGILFFVASFAVSLGPVMWVMFSEIFPNHLRGLAISAVSVINSLCSFIITLVFPWELENLGSATTFILYGVFAAVGFMMVYKFVPETKGLSLEEIEKELNAITHR
ncbi:sugar porter family MFS transporter [Alteromonas sp. 5E99-2]|uniref:sugar porter family MFS transporter n=1 Tax=Alteromonas sp. 5E99-2 TaxID=2817683 RepID=UPI001A993DEE|nr:sugar porter family MFS transporter [Alteromonas sp. 5E99-2]MBO1256016.1 sugar porter family MFS transporter [Alteromonas sp. 5E99-2]